MADVAKVDNVALASIAAVNGTAIGSIAAILGQTVPAGGIALVQQKADTIDDSSLTVTFDSAPTAGNTIIACLSFLDTATISALDCTGDGAMTQAVTSTTTGVITYIYYLHNNTAGSSEAALTLDSAVRASMHISEWSGLANAAPENTSTGTGTSTSMDIANSLLPSSASNLLIGIGGYVNATSDYSSGPSGGFTRLTQTGGASVFQECGYIIQSSATEGNSVLTLGSSLAWANAAAAFGGA